LPYAPDGFDPLDGDDFKDISSIKKFVEKVINLQIANGCSVLTAPFFYFENIGDDWFDINIKMLKESIDLIRRKYPQYKISGAICTNAEIFCRKKERSAIINQYGHCDPDFLQFYIDKICENTVDAQIYNFIKAALEIKNFNKTKIVACRVPAVAMGLLTVGFDAITSGLAVLESFDKGVITKEEDSARMPTRRYFPELLLSVSMTSKTKLHEEILAIESQIKKDNPKIKFNFECNCPGCQKNPMLSDIFQKPRLHFLCIRGMEIKELNDIKTSEQKKYFFARIDKAYYLQKELIKNGLKLNSPEYLMTWKDILKRF